MEESQRVGHNWAPFTFTITKGSKLTFWKHIDIICFQIQCTEEDIILIFISLLTITSHGLFILWITIHSISVYAAAAKSLQSCPTLWDPEDGSPPGSPIPGILQARTLEWVAISFSNAWKWKEKVKPLSRVRLLATILKLSQIWP